jgi:Queuosine biosynthesis protein QueC
MSNSSNRELVVDVVEVGARRRKGMVPCRLEQNIKFDLEVLESFSSLKWQTTVYDTLVVAAAVDFCDRSLARRASTWGRKFSVHVPVHDPSKWSDKMVSSRLVEALNVLTGDDWNFEFRARKAAVESPQQDRMRFPSNAESVIAYSEGMDSRAVFGLEQARLGGRVVRVRVGGGLSDVPKKERQRLPFTALPYEVKPLNNRNAESSARSRGFKFCVVSSMAAYLIDAQSVIVPESGQGALAPVLLPVGVGYEDYRSHPVFTTLMKQFFKALLGYEVQYRFPRLWTTKAETLREFVDVCGVSANWQSTRSCWQNSRQVAVLGRRRQCGICAACILRRLSVHAAGLMEPSENYIWESLKADTWKAGAAKDFSNFTSALKEYSIAGVLHFEHFARLQESVQYGLIKRRRVSELADSLSEVPVIVDQKLDRLLAQHAREWSGFKNDLGPGSFVRQWTDDI